jgi:hypothetical protein
MPQTLAEAQALAEENRFFHWPLEFPDVFAQGGFDVVLGNPPWERIKLQEEEFFAARDPQIATAPNKAARQKLIDALPKKNPALAQEFENAKHDAEATSKFVRASGRFPLTAIGDVNTYALFAEHARALLNANGRVGIILPTGIATDDTTKTFFGDLIAKQALASLYDFENREALFPGVHRSYKFCLLTLSGKPTPRGDFSFFATRVEHLRDERRRFALTAEEIALINPNTRTMPVFRTRADAELTKSIYRRFRVLVNERTGESPWNISIRQGLFHLTNDLREGKIFDGVVTDISTVNNLVPLYEAKLIWQFDHRFASYSSEGHITEDPTDVSVSRKTFPDTSIVARYYAPAEELGKRIPQMYNVNWFVVYRDVTNSTNERTTIATVIPRRGVAYTLRVIVGFTCELSLMGCFVANLNSLVFDYIARQAIPGMHLSDHVVKQLPALSPTAYTPADVEFIAPRVLELVYTAWDIKAFADDVWREANSELQIANSELRAAIQRQWEANRAATGGHPWEPPAWAEIAPDGIPLPPFTWDESRRAVLRAELDATYARLYGLTRKQLRYILDPADLTERELEDILDPWEEVDDPLDPAGYAARVAASAFPGETFRVLKEKELRQFGEYRTRRLVLEAWERLKSSKTKSEVQ